RIRKSMTDHARQTAIRILDELRANGNNPEAVLEQSVFNSWQGLFELRSDGHGINKAERRTLDNIRAYEQAVRNLEGRNAETDDSGGGLRRNAVSAAAQDIRGRPA